MMEMTRGTEPPNVVAGGMVIPSGITSEKLLEMRKLLTTEDRWLAILMFSSSGTVMTGLLAA